jgi:hypothetical protein
MTDVLDRLRADNPVKAGSAPSIEQVWTRVPQTPQWSQRRRPRLWTVAAATVSIVVPIMVVVLALGLLGHRQTTAPPTPPPPATSRPTTSQRAIPTVRQLLANFAVLRRPQNAIDRSWHPPSAANTRPLPRFTRFARELPNRDRAYLSISRYTNMGGHHIPLAGTDSLNLAIISANGVYVSFSFARSVNYSVIPISPLTPGKTAKRAPTWASIIPDGVARVRWRFGCPRASHCAHEHPVTITVPVVANVAAATVPSTSEGCAPNRRCRTPTAITWYADNGRVVARYRPLDSLRAPPFIR